jgi:hypothetical protein
MMQAVAAPTKVGAQAFHFQTVASWLVDKIRC